MTAYRSPFGFARPSVLAAAFACAMAAACAPITTVPAGKAVTMEEAFSVTPHRMWSKIRDGKVETWTINGHLLDVVTIYKGIEEGQSLVPEARGEAAKNLPKFRKTMTAFEVREMYQATMVTLIKANMEDVAVKPATFGGEEGFRLEFTFRTQSGLIRRGFAVGAIYRDKLYMITYTAPAMHYYDALAADAENLLSSIKKI